MTRFLPGAFTSRRTDSTTPEVYGTIGSTRKLGPRSRSTEVMEMTRDTRSPSEDAKRDIQVITDIEVQVEDRDGNVSGWRTAQEKDWDASGSVGLKTQSSTDTLVRETV